MIVSYTIYVSCNWDGDWNDYNVWYFVAYTEAKHIALFICTVPDVIIYNKASLFKVCRLWLSILKRVQTLIPVCRGRRFQSRAERVLDPRVGRGWLLRCWGQSHPYQDRDHHHGHQDPERSGREGTQNPRTDCCRSEEIQLPRGHRRALRWEGRYPWSLRHRSGRVSPIQAHRWFGCPKVRKTFKLF